jgi:polysaccharide export outer membrane protein
MVEPEYLPRELHKTTLPAYTIEPPDILVVEAIHLIPKESRIRSADILELQVENTLPDRPIMGEYLIEQGMVNLGDPYGMVRVIGMNREEAQRAIEEHLKQELADPKVNVRVKWMSGLQQVAGQHLVGPDGTVTLGAYGSISVVGQTLKEAKQTIEKHLSQFLEDPEVSVDIYSFNSKHYYVITAGAGLGDQIAKFPITGNETVLDAMANIQGMTEVSSKRIWIARPTADECGVQVLPVDWDSIAAQGATTSNYQLLPGDRLYIAESNLVAFDTALGKLLAPAERIFGFSTLGVQTLSRFSGKVLRNQNTNGGVFIPTN